jgi:hypothetical protein
VWRTDLDFVLPQRDQFFLLRFLLPENTTAIDLGGLPFDPSHQHANPSTNRPLFITDYPTSSSSTPHPGTQLLRLSDLWTTTWGSLSPEYINFAFALAVYSVSYSSVFWKTSRAFSGVMSLVAMSGTGLLLVAHCGFSVLYKVEVLDGAVLANNNHPHQQRRHDGEGGDGGHHQFLLTSGAVVALYSALVFTVVTCPAVVYLYGYQKLGAFLCKENAKTHVLAANGTAGGSSTNT